MLSPPYSPHADLVEELALGRVSSKPGPRPVGKLMASHINARSLPASSSHGSSGDELTDNDDLEDEESSGSVPPEDYSRPNFRAKRSASDAFLGGRDTDDNNEEEDDDEEDEEDDDSLIDPLSSTSSPATSISVSVSVSPTSSRSVRSASPPCSNVRERRMTTCWDALKTNPAKYLRQERSLLEMYPLRRHSWAGPGASGFGSEDGDINGMSSNAAIAAAAVSSVNSSKPASGRGRGRRAHRSASTIPAGGSASSVGRGRRRGSPSDASGTNSGSLESSEDFSGQRSGTNGSTGVRVHDLSLNQIKDYSPSLKTLPPGKSLRAEWKGAPMDLSNDPDLHLLHPAEAHLASVLRLPCEVYLDSKRRLFAEKVHRLKQGLPFRRTDSQKACRIDVNKASRLFGAFEKIGWLEDGLFLKFLN